MPFTLEMHPVYGDKCFTKPQYMFVVVCWVGRYVGRNSHQIWRCNQLFVSGLDSSHHRFLQTAFRNLFIDGASVQINLDDMLKNKTLIFDI